MQKFAFDFSSVIITYKPLELSVILSARTNAEIDLLIKHADKVLYVFHATILYLKQVNANLLKNISLLSVNSWRFIGLTNWPTSGSLL